MKLLGDVNVEAPAYAAALERHIERFYEARWRVFDRHRELFEWLALEEDRDRLIDSRQD